MEDVDQNEEDDCQIVEDYGYSEQQEEEEEEEEKNLLRNLTNLERVRWKLVNSARCDQNTRDALRKEVRELKERVYRLDSAKEALVHRVIKLEDEVRDHKEQVEVLTGENTKIEGHLKAKEEELEALKEAHQKLQDDYNCVKTLSDKRLAKYKATFHQLMSMDESMEEMGNLDNAQQTGKSDRSMPRKVGRNNMPSAVEHSNSSGSGCTPTPKSSSKEKCPKRKRGRPRKDRSPSPVEKAKKRGTPVKRARSSSSNSLARLAIQTAKEREGPSARKERSHSTPKKQWILSAQPEKEGGKKTSIKERRVSETSRERETNSPIKLSNKGVGSNIQAQNNEKDKRAKVPHGVVIKSTCDKDGVAKHLKEACHALVNGFEENMHVNLTCGESSKMASGQTLILTSRTKNGKPNFYLEPRCCGYDFRKSKSNKQCLGLSAKSGWRHKLVKLAKDSNGLYHYKSIVKDSVVTKKPGTNMDYLCKKAMGGSKDFFSRRFYTIVSQKGNLDARLSGDESNQKRTEQRAGSMKIFYTMEKSSPYLHVRECRKRLRMDDGIELRVNQVQVVRAYNVPRAKCLPGRMAVSFMGGTDEPRRYYDMGEHLPHPIVHAKSCEEYVSGEGELELRLDTSEEEEEEEDDADDSDNISVLSHVHDEVYEHSI